MARPIFNVIQSDAIGGGMENIFLEYSKIIKHNQDNIDADLICVVSHNFCHIKALKQNNIKVEILNITGHFDIIAAIKFYFLVKKYSPKLIIAHNGRGFALINLYKKFFGLKNSELQQIKTMAISHGGSIKRILGFDYIVAVAKHIEERVKSSNFKGKSQTIYNGYKVSDFNKNNRDGNIFTFGILSRLSKEKNVSEAIRMFKKFNDSVEKDSLLIIGGNGDEKNNLENLVKENNLEEKVKFIGWVNNGQEFFNQIDVFLQPALAEPFGITILESFNYKTPVIAANAFGPKEIIIDNYSGYLFDCNDEDSLFFAMKKSYEEKDQLSQITKNAKLELLKKFSYEIMEKDLMNSLKEVL